MKFSQQEFTTSQNTSQHNTPITPHKPTKNTPQLKKQKVNPFISFTKRLGVAIFIILLISTSLFAYILINPNSDVSRFVVNSTPLNEVISLNENQISQNEVDDIEDKGSESKLGNQILGLEQSDSNGSQQNTAQLVEKVLPSVLSITTSSRSNSLFPEQSAGTGIIISNQGLVLTNRHVIAQVCNEDSSDIMITALGSNLETYSLQLESVDPIDDIAFLSIINPPDNLSSVTFGDSESLVLGEEVVAIGNVLGEFQNTVTRGIVSGLDRTLRASDPDPCTGETLLADGLIQTDAAINRGNSGGPLFNSAGQLIGINTFGTTQGQNIGFAIPSATILSVLKSFQNNDRIERPRLGILSRPITPILREQSAWIPVDYGEIIISGSNDIEPITPGSAADQAGLEEGDIILAINDEELRYARNNQSPLRRELLKFQPNETIQLKVLRPKDFSTNNPTYADSPVVIEVTLGEVTIEDIL